MSGGRSRGEGQKGRSGRSTQASVPIALFLPAAPRTCQASTGAAAWARVQLVGCPH